MFDSNRRRYPRANYPCQLTLWLADGGNETILANTANIGAGGLSVNLNQSVDKDIKVDVQINFINPSTLFKCKGTIVRCEKESNKFYNIGIQFESMPEVKLHFLEGKVSELIELEQKAKN